MTTPIYDFLKSYAESSTLRLHMPGHKAKHDIFPDSQALAFDITEISGADSLFDACGIITESEENASRLFGTKKTLYSTQGSTLGIQTMLSLAASEGSVVVAPRNVHKAFVSSCALLGLDAEWIYPESSLGIASSEYTAADVEQAVMRRKIVSCVYITSPDYFGRLADIKGISAVCKKHGIPLLVDNAHGAHLSFMKENLHPIALGATMCCDSAHKTLPVVTGGAYIHIADEKFVPYAKEKAALFSSSSPSYITLCSLDLCNAYLESYAARHLSDVSENVAALKDNLPMWHFLDGEPLHLTVDATASGLTGYELADALRINGIECEYADGEYTVLLLSTITSSEDLSRLESVMKKIKQPKIRIGHEKLILPRLKKAMSIREATFAPYETIPVEKAAGRICAMTKVTCPPCVPIAVAGEVIEESCINILKKYSILQINVVK